MSIKEQLTEDMKAAMKAGETERLGTVRLLLSSLTNERIRVGHELSDDEANKVLQREAKQRRDSIEQYKAASRPELAAKEESELAIVQNYLPQQLSEEDLKKLVDEALAGLGSDPQMGAVIGAVMAKVGAQADGATVSRLVRERLAV